MDLISECFSDRCLMKYAGMSLVRRNGDPDFDTEKELEKFLEIAKHQHETLIALRAEQDALQKRVGELEAGVRKAASLACPCCAAKHRPIRDRPGSWFHTNGDECEAAHLWEILEPKTDPGCPLGATDNPLSGDGGDGVVFCIGREGLKHGN